jgi:hypothetical protein
MLIANNLVTFANYKETDFFPISNVTLSHLYFLKAGHIKAHILKRKKMRFLCIGQMADYR